MKKNVKILDKLISEIKDEDLKFKFISIKQSIEKDLNNLEKNSSEILKQKIDKEDILISKLKSKEIKNDVSINNHFVGEVKYTNTDLGISYVDQFQNIWIKTTNNIGAAILIADDSNIDTISSGSIPITNITGEVFNSLTATFTGNTLPDIQVDLEYNGSAEGIVDRFWDSIGDGGTGDHARGGTNDSGNLYEDIANYLRTKMFSAGTPTGSVAITDNGSTISINPIGTGTTNNAYGIYRYEYTLVEKGNDIIINFDDYYTKEEVDALIEGIDGSNTNLNGFDNTNWIEGKSHNFNDAGFPGWSTGNGSDAFINNSTLNVNGRTISNLLDGINSNDAVTVNQMNNVMDSLIEEITPLFLKIIEIIQKK